MFYGTRENAPMSKPEVDRAKAVCAGCPVRAVCLNEALATDEEFGIWGGYTTPERTRAVEVLGYIDVAADGEIVRADVETVMDVFEAGALDALVLL